MMTRNRPSRREQDGIVVAVIPARGGSKGVPLKNLREIGHRPLIAHTISAAHEAKTVDRVVVSTDSDEIAAVARALGAEIPFLRPAHLADDRTPLAAVMKHFLDWAQEAGWDISTLVILEPTSPLRTAEMIDEAVRLFWDADVDTVVSVERDTSLGWEVQPNGQVVPLQKERLNRQYMNPRFKENGAIFVTRPDVVTEDTTVGPNVALYEMSPASSIDVNTYFDLYLADVLLRRVKIVFHFRATAHLGFGHFYRVLTLANHLYYHDVVLVCSEYDDSLRKRIATTSFKYYLAEDPLPVIRREAPDILVNDILDTTREQMRELRGLAKMIVNFEDLGEGRELADLVFNALYEDFSLDDHHFGGAQYAILRDEFLFLPRRLTREKVQLITATFGGSDPNNIALHCMRVLPAEFPDIHFRVIIGPGYGHDKTEIRHLAEVHTNAELIDVATDMARHLSESDLVITSGGRTVFEAAACGAPCIVICQNLREMSHRHITERDGVINLGLFDADRTMSLLLRVVRKLVANPEKRAIMSERAKSLVDGLGLYRVVGLIEKIGRRKGVFL